MSASEKDAEMTTAARAGCGRLRSNPGATSSMMRIAVAPTSPVTWVRAPLWKATAVRDPLVLTGKPWKSPAAMLATPTPTISRFTVDLCAGLVGEHGRGGDGVGEGDQGDAKRAGEQQGQVTERHGGDGERWEPGRQRADEGDIVVLEVEHGDGRDREEDGSENAREDRPQALEDQDQRQTCHADCECCSDGLAVLDCLGERDCFINQPVRVDREPEQLRQLADEDGEREAVHVSDLGRLREKVGDEAELENAGEHGDRADHESKHGGVADGGLRASVRGHEWYKCCGDHRAERRIRSEDQDARRTEQGVPDQGEDRGVQPGDDRQARQLRVRHPLRNQESGEDKSRDEVLAEEGGPIPPQHRQARHRARKCMQARGCFCRHARTPPGRLLARSSSRYHESLPSTDVATPRAT